MSFGLSRLHLGIRIFGILAVAICVTALGTAWQSLHACTTVVISGKVTTDGRPILWKNRDTSDAKNEVACFKDGKYKSVAVVNAGNRGSVWMGVNEAGFCIENSVSKDLSVPGENKGPGNGGFMKLALQTCGSVAEFEVLLEETDKTGRSTVANYGVIDAVGGAAMFETGPKSFTKIDANDEQESPTGYVVRSNFSTTANQLPLNPTKDEVENAKLYSGQRYARACSVLESRDSKLIDVALLLRKMTRDMADESGQPYVGTVAGAPGQMPPTIPTASTISRTTTVSAAVFHGARTGEDAATATMWTLLGDPKFTIAVPCWVTGEPVADPLEDPLGGELGEIARTLRDWGMTKDAVAVTTSVLPGIWKDLWALEDDLLQRVNVARERWSGSGFDPTEAATLHRSLADEAMEAMKLEMHQAKQDALYSVLDGNFDNTVLAKQDKIKVAIYDHSTGNPEEPLDLNRILSEEDGFECARLHPDEIRYPKMNEFDLLIVPGGSGSLQAAKLGEDGRNTIRQFVKEGGGYLGICAGSYLATSQYSWSLGLVNARVWDRVHWARGTGTVTLAFTEDGMEALSPPDQTQTIYYGQGPLLLPDNQPDLPAYEVLASFKTEIAKKGAPEDAMVDTHAMIRSEYGDGRVVCLSPHPEKTGGPNWMITSAVRWAAKNREPVAAEE